MIAVLLRTLSLFLTRWLAGARAVWPGGEPMSQQRIYCANHTSHLDAVFVLAALRRHQLRTTARPLAAAEYWRAGAVRRYFAQHVFGAVPIERARRQLHPLEPAFQALRQGDSLILFPEGTRGPGSGLLQPLKPGLFCLARAFPDVDIVPVWIDNAYRILPKGAWWPVPMPCSLTFGAPLRWEGEQDASAFLARVRDGLEAARRHAESTAARERRPVPRRFSINDV